MSKGIRVIIIGLPTVFATCVRWQHFRSRRLFEREKPWTYSATALTDHLGISSVKWGESLSLLLA